ncbi:unnamed protein product [Durusdinium trenchii]|uniref:Transmembrane protein n=1 Tax=Durusdinium trenchii TaxID=1381693 RepID=A0ABP0JMF4_9DINO
MEDWAAQYEDDPALLESPAQKQAAENNEWRREGLEVTKGNTQKFAKAHSTLREAAAQFYIINGATLAIPSLLEFVVACRNFSSPCVAVATLMALDGGICLASNFVSLWLFNKREVLGNADLQARGDAAPEDEDLPRKAANFNKVLSWAVKAMVASMLISLILWIIGFVVIWVEDLSSCSEVRSWLRFILVIRAFMPFLVMCCIIPIQELCCEAV